jgi:hypothetical protein
VDKLGFYLDVDHQPSEEFLVVQMTPPRLGMLDHDRDRDHGGDAGLLLGHYLVVTDIEAAQGQLVGRGVDVSEIRHRRGQSGT